MVRDPVDLHDLVRVRDFRDQKKRYTAPVVGRRPVVFFTTASTECPEIGFSLAWPWVRAPPPA